MTRLFLLAAALVMGPPVAAAPPLDDITVTIEPTARSVVLGEDLELRVTVTNDSTEPRADLVAHLDITDPTSAKSVDPEDWTSTLSKPVGTIAPGASTTVSWTIQPISGGDFIVYAVAIAPDASTVAASNVLTVSVADERSLNPGGILPLASGAPTLIGALLLIRIRASRRTTRTASPDNVSNPTQT